MSGSILLGQQVKMPLLGFGTYKLKGLEMVNVALDAALGAGYRHVDTAQAYENEAEIGQSLKDLLPKYNLKREEIFLTTKLSPSNMKQADVVPSIRESLKKLGVDHVDLCLIHYPRPGWAESQDQGNKEARKEAWKGMETAQKEGLAKCIGISNYEVGHLEEMESYARIRPAVNQTEFHPHFTRADVLAYCRSHDIQFQAYTSLGRNDPSLLAEPELIRIAKIHSATPQQILIAWALCQGIGALPKSATPERIRANYESCRIQLSSQEITSLTSLNKNHNYTKCTPWDVV